MTGPGEEDCPVYNSSTSEQEQFAAAKVAKHMKEEARQDESHQQWGDTHTTNGTLAEIRESLTEQVPSEQ